jgi:hypothetical protein
MLGGLGGGVVADGRLADDPDNVTTTSSSGKMT